MKTKSVMKFLALFFLLTSLFALRSLKIEAKTYTLNAEFSAVEDDSFDTIRGQLFLDATKSLIQQVFLSQNLNSKEFFDLYLKKWQDEEVKVRDVVMKKHGLSEETLVVSPSEKVSEFYKDLRVQTLKKETEVYNFLPSLGSYTIKSQSKNFSQSGRKTMVILSRPDLSYIRNLYHRTLGNELSQSPRRLYLVLDNIEMINTSWADLEMTGPLDLVSSLRQNWKSWLEENLKSSIDDVEIADSNLENSITSEIKSAAESGSSNFYKNTLLLKMNAKVEKVKANALLGSKTFKLSGNYLLLDVASNTPLDSYEFEEIKFTHTKDTSKQALALEVVNTFHYIPLSQFSKFDEKIKRISSKTDRMIVQVEGLSNISELFQVADMIGASSSKEVTTNVVSYTGASGGIAISYKDERGAMENILASIVNKNVGEDGRVSYSPRDKVNTLDINRFEVYQRLPASEAVSEDQIEDFSDEEFEAQ